jgi:hypothetical protein
MSFGFLFHRILAEGSDNVNIIYLVSDVLVFLVVEEDGLKHDEPTVDLVSLYEIFRQLVTNSIFTQDD